MATQKQDEKEEKKPGSQNDNGRSDDNGKNKNQGQSDDNNSGTSSRGFASMDEDQQREIASKGGKAAHESGHAHEFDSEEARGAGRKGGEAVSQDKEHMAEIGRKGGEARQGSNDDNNRDKNG